MARGRVGRALYAARQRYGMTQAEAGRFLGGISGRMVRKIEAGEAGERYEQAVAELRTRGVVTTPVERREMRVRAPGGRTRPAVIEPPLTRGPDGTRSYGVQRVALTDSRRQTVIDAPRSGRVGRARAKDTLVNDLEGHRGGPRDRGGQRVGLTVTTTDGRTYEIGRKGGYDPAVMARRMRSGEFDADPFRWIADTLQGMGYKVAGGDIVSVSLTYN